MGEIAGIWSAFHRHTSENLLFLLNIYYAQKQKTASSVSLVSALFSRHLIPSTIYVAKKPERLQRKINFFISALFSRHLIPSTIYVAKKPERLQRKINFFIF